MAAAGANSARCTPVARSRVCICAASRVPSRCNSPLRSPRHPGSEPSTNRVSWPSCASRHSRSTCKRHLSQIRRSLSPRFKPHQPGVGQIQAQVGSRGLSAQSDAPVAWLLLPERKVRVHQRERQLLRAPLEVDARVGCLKVRQRRLATVVSLPRSCLSRRNRFRCRCAKQRIEIPSPFWRAHHVQAGIVHADCADLQKPAPQRHEPYRSRDRVGMKHRFRAKSRIFLNDQIG